MKPPRNSNQYPDVSRSISHHCFIPVTAEGPFEADARLDNI